MALSFICFSLIQNTFKLHLVVMPIFVSLTLAPWSPKFRLLGYTINGLTNTLTPQGMDNFSIKTYLWVVRSAVHFILAFKLFVSCHLDLTKFSVSRPNNFTYSPGDTQLHVAAHDRRSTSNLGTGINLFRERTSMGSLVRTPACSDAAQQRISPPHLWLPAIINLARTGTSHRFSPIKAALLCCNAEHLVIQIHFGYRKKNHSPAPGLKNWGMKLAALAIE